jgi:hypothetical protein
MVRSLLYKYVKSNIDEDGGEGVGGVNNTRNVNNVPLRIQKTVKTRLGIYYITLIKDTKNIVAELKKIENNRNTKRFVKT